MEKQIKERLIGAAVLVAIAVILIPELLSGRGEDSLRLPEEADAASGDVKTYTFDLTNGSSRAGKLTRTPVPPPEEEVTSTPVSVEAPVSVEQDSMEQPQAPAAHVELAPPQEQVASEPIKTVAHAPVQTRSAAAATAAESSKAAASGDALTGWAVQLGSFADQARARRLQEQMQRAGHNAYIVPLRRQQAAPLHRVRIGPFEQRAAAESALKKLNLNGAAVVKQ